MGLPKKPGFLTLSLLDNQSYRRNRVSATGTLQPVHGLRIAKRRRLSRLGLFTGVDLMDGINRDGNGKISNLESSVKSKDERVWLLWLFLFLILSALFSLRLTSHLPLGAGFGGLARGVEDGDFRRFDRSSDECSNARSDSRSRSRSLPPLP